MNLPFELYVSIRYLVARRKQASMASTSLISVLGVTVGVTALIVALALMTGLQQELRDRIVGSQAHVYVWNVLEGGFADYREAARTLAALPDVEAAAPAIPGRALARTRGGDVFMNVKGIDPELEAAVTDLEGAVSRGSLADLARYDGPALGGIVIGEGFPGIWARSWGTKSPCSPRAARCRRWGCCRAPAVSRWSASSVWGCSSTTRRTAS